LQKVQGPNPSFTQIILPQARQLGLASSSGWRWAIHGHFRRAFCSGVRAKDGFVCISSSRIADSRSVRAVDWPCMGVPPVMVTLVFDLDGDDEREDGLESDIRRPAAEGGSLGVDVLDGTFELDPEPATGVTINSGFCCKAREFARGACASFRGLDLPDR